MPFERPTLTQLVDRTQQDVVSRLELGGAVLRRAIVRVFTRALAGAVHMLHGRLEYLSRQVFPWMVESEHLTRWADLYGIARKAADYAQGTVIFTGSDGSVMDAGAVLVRADGQRYAVDADATISSGEATAAVTALAAGSDGTLIAGEPLSLESPIAGVSSSAEVDESTIDGTDQESDAELLSRLRARLADPPQGGAETDYTAWALEVEGVTRAWVYPLELGAGTVVVRFVRDNDGTGSAIIPSAGEVTAVQEHIDEVRPVTADVTVVAPTAVTRNFTISITPDTADTREAVEAELEDMLRRTVEPGGTLLFSQVEVAVGTADGITDFTVTSPAADVNYSTGELPVMGTVTWV